MFVAGVPCVAARAKARASCAWSSLNAIQAPVWSYVAIMMIASATKGSAQDVGTQPSIQTG